MKNIVNEPIDCNEIISKYKELNEKCDKILERIRQKKYLTAKSG